MSPIVGIDDDFNLYAYVGNDPMTSTDPTGLASVCAASTGSRIESCVGVDGNGDGDVTDNDLTRSQIRTLSNDFATFIQNNSGRNISASGATVVGEDNDQTRFIRATSQFVGDAMGGWDGIKIQMADTAGLRWATRDDGVDSETRGYFYTAGSEKLIGVNTDSLSTFAKAGNAARTLIHERLHERYPTAHFTLKEHRRLDDRARGLLASYGLSNGGCESIGGIVGFFATFPACN